jgi:hypothetical protein
MSSVRPVTPGKTRTCPHCKAVILESASVCPGCQHHLRFGSDAGKVEARNALHIEGLIRHPPDEEPWEYSVVVYVRNERDEEVARHVINVGALAQSEARTVSLAVDVMPPRTFVPIQKAAPLSPPGAVVRPAAASPVGSSAAPAAPPAPPGQPLQPAKTILTPPKPGDPYSGSFGRNKR